MAERYDFPAHFIRGQLWRARINLFDLQEKPLPLYNSAIRKAIAVDYYLMIEALETIKEHLEHLRKKDSKAAIEVINLLLAEWQDDLKNQAKDDGNVKKAKEIDLWFNDIEQESIAWQIVQDSKNSTGVQEF